MSSIKDNRGYNQGFKITKALVVRTNRRCDIITKNFSKKKARTLEIGCGVGLHAYIIAKGNPNIEVVSTDICKSFVEQARKDYKLKNLRYEVLDFNDKKAVQNILSKEGGFDYIYGDGILHHLYTRLDKVIADLKIMLKPGGKLLFWEPNIINPYCFLIFKYRYFRKRANLEPNELAFSKKHIKNILACSGFNQIKTIHKDFLLPNTPELLIKPTIQISNLVEKIPIVNCLSQSIFISAQKEK